jgi:Ca-activated chloride channel homolog
MISNFFSSIHFEKPGLLWLLLLLIPLVIAYYISRNKNRIILPAIQTIPKVKSASIVLRNIKIWLRSIAIASLILLIASPYQKDKKTIKRSDGINIIICMDVSGSMTAKDFTPSRLGACKTLGIDFLKKRPYDKIGVVVFSGQPYTASPLTHNNEQLHNVILGLDNNQLIPGTAVGEGIAMSIARLENALGNKVIILFTDGKEEGDGKISAIAAAERARQLGIRIYSIGMGSNSIAAVPTITNENSQPFEKMQKVSFDESSLKKIASITNGKYFKAQNNQVLSEIYTDINTIEKTTAEVSDFEKKHFIFLPFLITSILCILLEMFIRARIVKEL